MKFTRKESALPPVLTKREFVPGRVYQGVLNRCYYLALPGGAILDIENDVYASEALAGIFTEVGEAEVHA